MTTVVVLVPAHNEAAVIGQTLSGLAAQTRPADRVIVVSDNSTDDTTHVALAGGAEVIETIGNTDKKSGALNQAMAHILPTLGATDYILVQDADTELSPQFIEVALSRMKRRVGAVGGSFYARTETNWLQAMQGNEYARYVREIARRHKAKANVLTGAGSLFRADVLGEVQQARLEGRLPGRGVYNQTALTEDNELTICIKRLGYIVVSPKACAIYTDVPDTWSELKDQRIRWRRGALEDLHSHGFNRVTAPYIGKTVWAFFVTIMANIYLLLLAGVIATGGSVIPNLFWITVFAIYIADRWWTIRDRPARAQLLAIFAPAEMIYDAFQQAVLVIALTGFIRRSEQRWVPNTRKQQHV